MAKTDIYYCIFPHPGMSLTEEEKVLIPLLSKKKRALCTQKFQPRPLRMSFYGEIIPLWLWSKAHPKRRLLPRVRYAKKGKPRIGFSDFHYSVTHTEGGIFVAVSNTPVGIDAERPREVNFSVAERYFDPKDHAKLRHTLDPDRLYSTLWTRLEAYTKYLGTGIPIPAPKRCLLQNFALSVTHPRATSPIVRGISVPKGSPFGRAPANRVRGLASPISLASTVTAPQDYIVSVYPPAEEMNLIPLTPEEIIHHMKGYL